MYVCLLSTLIIRSDYLPTVVLPSGKEQCAIIGLRFWDLPSGSIGYCRDLVNPKFTVYILEQ